MNRQQWSKLRHLYRLKRLVYYSYGDEVPDKVYEEKEAFPDAVKHSVANLYSDHGYNIREIMAKSGYIKSEYPDNFEAYKATLRDCMRGNTLAPRINHFSRTPCNYFRGTGRVTA